jgi:signal transduction histidine kinase
MERGPIDPATPTAARLLEILAQARRLAGKLDMDGVLQTSFAALKELVPFETATIRLLEDEGLKDAASAGEPAPRTEGIVEEPLIAGGRVLGLLTLSSHAFGPEDGAVLSAFVPFIASAITNAAEYEAQRCDADRIQHEHRLQKDVLSIVSHELRTPLSVVMGYAETLANNIEQLDQEQVVDISNRTRDAGRRLARLIGDLFDLAETDRGSLAVTLYPTSVERVLRQASFEVPGRKHRLEVQCDPGLPPVLADRDRLNQVVVNLVANAKKYSPEGTNVTVTAERVEDEIAISVADEGMGIPAEAQTRIFERFYRVEDAAPRKPGGMGVGLFLVKEICDRMNATIELKSEVGRGTRVTIRLPVAEALAS